MLFSTIFWSLCKFYQQFIILKLIELVFHSCPSFIENLLNWKEKKTKELHVNEVSRTLIYSSIKLNMFEIPENKWTSLCMNFNVAKFTLPSRPMKKKDLIINNVPTFASFIQISKSVEEPQVHHILWPRNDCVLLYKFLTFWEKKLTL